MTTEPVLNDALANYMRSGGKTLNCEPVADVPVKLTWPSKKVVVDYTRLRARRRWRKASDVAMIGMPTTPSKRAAKTQRGQDFQGLAGKFTSAKHFV